MRKTTEVFTLLALCIGIDAHAQMPIADAFITIDGTNYPLSITTLGTDNYAVENMNGGPVQVMGAGRDTADIFAHAFRASDNVWEIDYTLNWVNPNGPGNVTFGIYGPVHTESATMPGGPTLTNSNVEASITTLDTDNSITPLAVTTFPNNPDIVLPPDMGATTLQRVFLGTGTSAYDTGQDLGGPESFPTASTYSYGPIGPGPGIPDPIGSPHYDYMLLTSSFSTGGNGINVMLNGSASETYVPEPTTLAMLVAGMFSSLLVARRRRARR